MKSPKYVCNANIPNSLHSLLDIDANLNVTDEEAIRSSITKFINDNYYTREFTISDKPNKYGKYEVSSNDDVAVINKNITSLTNDLFVWDIVKGDFICALCDSLKSLEGAPKKVGNSFSCSNCSSLKSLEGGPKEVIRLFICSYCNSLQSLEGAPKEVGGYFDCSSCSSLESLKGAPKKIGGYFYCHSCKVQFKESDVKAVSKVLALIYV